MARRGLVVLWFVWLATLCLGVGVQRPLDQKAEYLRAYRELLLDPTICSWALLSGMHKALRDLMLLVTCRRGVDFLSALARFDSY